MPGHMTARPVKDETAILSSDTLLKCMDIATTAESAEYLCTRFEEEMTQARMQDKTSVVRDKLSDYANYQRIKESATGSPWEGKEIIPAGFQSYQRGISAKAANVLNTDEAVFHYCITDNSQIFLGYFNADGTRFDEESTNAMHDKFKDWLAGNHMINKGGFIYHGTSKGEIKLDKQGNPLLVDPQKLKAMLANEDNGIVPFALNQDKPMSLTLVERESPGKAEKKPAARTETGAEPSGPATGA